MVTYYYLCFIITILEEIDASYNILTMYVEEELEGYLHLPIIKENTLSW